MNKINTRDLNLHFTLQQELLTNLNLDLHHWAWFSKKGKVASLASTSSKEATGLLGLILKLNLT